MPRDYQRPQRSPFIGLPLEEVLYGHATADYQKAVDMVAEDPSTTRICERYVSADRPAMRLARRRRYAAIAYAATEHPELKLRMREKTVSDDDGTWTYVYADARGRTIDD